MSKFSLQHLLFQRILTNFVRRAEAVETLSAMLNVGRDAIYRRIRADTAITPDEMALLANHFNISLDQLSGQGTDTVLFHFNAFGKPVRSFEDYLENVRDLMVGVANLNESRIWYASQTLPIFHYLYSPELTAFKLYAYGQSVWALEYLFQRPFSFDLIPEPQLRSIPETIRAYNSVPGINVWTNTVADNTIQQIEYALHVGAFRKAEDALVLLKKMEEVFQHLMHMSKVGQKFAPGGTPTSGAAPFELYHNELFHLSNTIYVHTEAHRMVFSTFSNPNFLQTTDPKFCDYTQNWLQRVLDRSTGLTGQNERARRTFFNTIFRKISAAKTRVRAFIENPNL